MDNKRFQEIIDKIDANWEGDNCYKGLKIISKYVDIVVTGACHDTVFSVDVDTLIEKGITEEDIYKLANLNWSISESECLMCFV